jgi:Tfp pilus assembly protein PilX
MKRIFLTLLFIGLCAVAAFSQTTEEQLATANQRLVKTLDNLEKAESLIKTLESEIEARKRLEATNNEIIKAKDNVIEEQKKLIEIYKSQSQRKIQFLWGLVKIRF